MKKLILITTMAVLAMSLAACTAETKTTEKASNSTAPASQSENQITTSVKTLVGQVSDKIGNDITLSIGNFVLDNNGEESESFMIDENGEIAPYSGDIDEGAVENQIVVAMPDDENSNGSENGSGTGAVEKMPIEFTGEVEEFTIPAGAKITNLAGKEVTIDTVKKGSLVQIIVNESTNVVEKVLVWE